jgi:hypothetical protein
MAAMRTSYGTAAAADIEALLVQLSEPIQGGDHDTLMSFTIGFRQIVAALDRAGQPLSQYMQCRRLQETTVSQSNIASALRFTSKPIRCSLTKVLPSSFSSSSVSCRIRLSPV